MKKGCSGIDTGMLMFCVYVVLVLCVLFFVSIQEPYICTIEDQTLVIIAQIQYNSCDAPKIHTL